MQGARVGFKISWLRQYIRTRNGIREIMVGKRKKGKKRGGRPRMANVPREPNGRPSRAVASARSYRDAIAVRARQFAISEDEARDARSGSVIGRMAMHGAISADQYRAANRYIEVRHAYLRAIEVKQDFRQPPPDVESDCDHESFCRMARSAHDRMQDALSELCLEMRSPAPRAALDVFIQRDVYLQELEGDLRTALNKLSRHFFGGLKNVA